MLELEKRETPHEYAQRMANESGRRYMVSDFGRALAYTREGLRHLRDIGEKPVAIYSPQGATSARKRARPVAKEAIITPRMFAKLFR